MAISDADAKERTIREIAAELAPELADRVEAFLNSLGQPEKVSAEGNNIHNVRRAELAEFLWDNKIGLLRIAQAHGRT